MKLINIKVVLAGEKTIEVSRSFDKDLAYSDIIQDVFDMFNYGSGRECPEFIAAKCRSLSVGDFVQINDEAIWQVQSIGWKNVTKAYMNRIDSLVKMLAANGNLGSYYHLSTLMNDLQLDNSLE